MFADSEFGSGLGYQQYGHIEIYNICQLWPESIGHFLASLNSAMKHGSQLNLKILPPVPEYKTYHDFEYFERILSGKGFSNIQRESDWIFAHK